MEASFRTSVQTDARWPCVASTLFLQQARQMSKELFYTSYSLCTVSECSKQISIWLLQRSFKNEAKPP